MINGKHEADPSKAELLEMARTVIMSKTPQGMALEGIIKRYHMDIGKKTTRDRINNIEESIIRCTALLEKQIEFQERFEIPIYPAPKRVKLRLVK